MASYGVVANYGVCVVAGCIENDMCFIKKHGKTAKGNTVYIWNIKTRAYVT